MDPLSRRTFVERGLVLGGGVFATGVVAACGSSSSKSSATTAATATTMPMTNPDQALKRLQAGNARFVAGRLDHPGRDTVRRAEQAETQTPFAVILGCSDSRVPPEIVFDEGIGDLFPVRVAGNTGDDDIVLGTIEYGAVVLKCVLVVVLGHENCGAVKAAVDQVVNANVPPGHIESVLKPLVPAVEGARATSPPDLVHASMLENVRLQVSHLKTSQPLLAPLVTAGTVNVVGAEYNLTTGKVDFVT